jgi:hypothetical protein
VDFPGYLECPSERDLQISTVKESIKKKLLNMKKSPYLAVYAATKRIFVQVNKLSKLRSSRHKKSSTNLQTKKDNI